MNEDVSTQQHPGLLRRLLTFKLFFPLRYRLVILLNPYVFDLGFDDVFATSLPV